MIKKVNFIFFLIAVLVLFSCILISCENQWMQDLIKELKDKKERGDSLGSGGGNDGGGGGGGYTIGQIGPGGGIIFYDKGNNSEGWRYLEASPVDLGPCAWAAYGQEYTNIIGTETSIGKGENSTYSILLQDPDAPAARECRNYLGGGQNDWFLPSLEELNELYEKRTIAGISEVNEYWSSSQANNNEAWLQFFGIGSQYYGAKSNAIAYVRPIRAF